MPSIQLVLMNFHKFLFFLSDNLKACWKDIFEKYSVLQMKLLADLLENHPFSFLPVMKEALNVICRLCFTPEGEGVLFQRFIIMCFNIIKQVLLCPEYKLPKQADDDPELHKTPAFQGHTIKTEFFEPTTVTEVAKCLISNYLLLSKDDLELWDSDPEQYGKKRFYFIQLYLLFFSILGILKKSLLL